jgi:hypothetical protein
LSRRSTIACWTISASTSGGIASACTVSSPSKRRPISRLWRCRRQAEGGDLLRSHG